MAQTKAETESRGNRGKARWLDSDLPRTETIFQSLSFHAGRAREFVQDLDHLASAADPDSVFWLEVRKHRAEPECELRSAPVSVARMMGDFLYSRVESMISTSATLTVDGSFDFIMERLGLDREPDWKVLTLDVGSPYDYDAQSVAVVAGYLIERTTQQGGPLQGAVNVFRFVAFGVSLGPGISALFGVTNHSISGWAETGSRGRATPLRAILTCITPRCTHCFLVSSIWLHATWSWPATSYTCSSVFCW